MDGNFFIALEQAEHELFFLGLFFGLGWFLFYGLIGSWLKVKLATNKNSQDRRFGPVFVSHIVFSMIMVNPYITKYIFYYFTGYSDFNLAGSYLFVGCYFTLLPLVLELISMRLIARLKWFKWFLWRPELKKVVPISLLTSLIGLGGGYLAMGLYLIIKQPSCAI